MKERWKQVEGYPNYTVSNLGRVYSKWAKRCLKLSPSHSYLRVNLSHGTTRKIFVHILVLTAFKGPAPSGHVCNHKNGIKSDARLRNLEWVTPSRNREHAKEHGLYPTGDKHPQRIDPSKVLRGQQNGRSKLTAKIVKEARERYTRGGILQRELAEEYGVDRNTMHWAINRRSWKHVK